MVPFSFSLSFSEEFREESQRDSLLSVRGVATGGTPPTSADPSGTPSCGVAGGSLGVPSTLSLLLMLALALLLTVLLFAPLMSRGVSPGPLAAPRAPPSAPLLEPAWPLSVLGSDGSLMTEDRERCISLMEALIGGRPPLDVPPDPAVASSSGVPSRPSTVEPLPAGRRPWGWACCLALWSSSRRHVVSQWRRTSSSAVGIPLVLVTSTWGGEGRHTDRRVTSSW